MWMDDALMDVLFSSLPVPGLTKVVNSLWPFIFSFLQFPQPRLVLFWGTFFFSSPPTPAQVSLSYLHLDYLPMHSGLLPPPPTYLPTYLRTHPPNYLLIHRHIYLPTHPFTYLIMYLHIKPPPRQWWHRPMKIL
jgi:hypothetical protein